MAQLTYQQGETILVEDTPGDQSFRILSGEVMICKSTQRKGGSIQLARLGAGEIFGEMYLLDQTGYRSASAVAATDVTVEVISREEMLEKIQSVPPEMLSAMGALSRRLRNTSRQYAFVMTSKSSPTPPLEVSREKKPDPES